MNLEVERHEFNSIKQEIDETFESFVDRLYKKGLECKFNDLEFELKNQLIKKCQNENFRQYALKNFMTLKDLILVGISLNKQKPVEIFPMEKLAEDQETKKCETKMQKSPEKEKRQNVTNHNSSTPQFKETRKFKDCVRCGLSDHFSNYSSCDALKEKCGYCRKLGHFTRMCWDLNVSRKRPRQDDSVKLVNKIPKLSIEPRKSEFTDRNSKYSSKTSRNKTKSETSHRNGQKVHTRPESTFKSPHTNIHYKTDDQTLMKKFENFDQLPKKIFSASSSNLNMETPPRSPVQTNSQKTPPKIDEPPKIALDTQESLKVLKVKPPTATPLTISTADKTFDCLLGGKAVKLVKDKTVPCNIMSSMLFDKLRESKFKEYSREKFDFKTGQYNFIGHVTSKIEINSLVKFITFSIREGKEDFAIVGKEKSRELKLY